jgi:8-oxo-dGTP pyrophosphatase MutT (NUDIX family)
MRIFPASLEFFKNHPLPGEMVHQEMAPINRPLASFARKNKENIRPSAVAIIVVENENHQEIVLIQRPNYEGTHGGQVSFPGGKKETTDRSLLETAMRECSEEIGLNLNESQFVRALTSVYIPVSNFDVAPFVFYHPSSPNFTADEREVESIFSIRLIDLLDEDSVGTMQIIPSNGNPAMQVPCFNVSNKQIWGATALILNEFKKLLSSYLESEASKPESSR